MPGVKVDLDWRGGSLHVGPELTNVAEWVCATAGMELEHGLATPLQSYHYGGAIARGVCVAAA